MELNCCGKEFLSFGGMYLFHLAESIWLIWEKVFAAVVDSFDKPAIADSGRSEGQMEVFNNWPKLQMFHFQTSQRQKAQIIKRPRPMVEYNSRYFERVKERKVFNASRSSFEGTCICWSICRDLQLSAVGVKSRSNRNVLSYWNFLSHWNCFTMLKMFCHIQNFPSEI